MNAAIHAWQGWPDGASLYRCWQQHQRQYPQQTLYLLIVAAQTPDAAHYSPADNPTLAALNQRLQQAVRYWQQQSRYVVNDLLPGTTLLWLPESSLGELQPTQWHTPTLASTDDGPDGKPWLAMPPVLPAEHVLVIGAGIAGAACAYALAQRGIRVSVVDKHPPAQAASGNRQGLLYAKIAAHPTAQTELLLAGYAYSRQLLDLTLPDNTYWQACGVLHLNHNAAETRRNQQLAAQQPHSPLYQAVNSTQASALAGIPVSASGLWWPHGAWIHPPAWVAALLAHPRITLISPVQINALAREHGRWRLDYHQHGRQQHLHGSHVVLCGGADSVGLPLLHGWPLQQIRGQTTVAQAGPLAQQLRCALSGASYISPAWQNRVCFGASFAPNDGGHDWRAAEQQHNWRELAALNPALAADVQTAQGDTHRASGHAAVRCDSFDHLPVVGPLGDAVAMHRVYARLAQDKNTRLHDTCPWLPGVFVSTAHGSRGLSTAPLCGEAVACALLGLPSPLPPRLQQALHPNRLAIRSLTHHQPWPAGNHGDTAP